MMTTVVESEFNPQSAMLLHRLSLEEGSDEAADFLDLLEKARKIARPKAAFIAIGVDFLDASGKIVVGGVEFSSRVLAEKVAGAHMIWPHIATCGRELHEFSLSIPDPFERYWCDAIMDQALSDARVAMLQRVEKDFSPGKVAVMNPGSLAAWPIQQQAPLFRLLDEAAGLIGVELTGSMLMVPNKSVSGVLFPSEEGWESCVMCPRDKCPNRRARYDAEAVAALDA